VNEVYRIPVINEMFFDWEGTSSRTRNNMFVIGRVRLECEGSGIFSYLNVKGAGETLSKSVHEAIQTLWQQRVRHKVHMEQFRPRKKDVSSYIGNTQANVQK
jgi:hypothetical protein